VNFEKYQYETIYTLVDSEGNSYWEINRDSNYDFNFRLCAANNGISTLSKDNIIYWIDPDSTVINTLELEENVHGYSRPLKNGKYWFILKDMQSYEGDYYEDPDFKKEMIYTDKQSNVLIRKEFKYNDLYDRICISKNDNYLMFVCTDYDSKTGQNKQSYLLRANGELIKEYEDIWLGNGSFSDDEKLFISDSRNSRILDVETGEFITYFNTYGDSRIANKGTDIFVNNDDNQVRVINYKTGEKLFSKKFNVPNRSYEVKWVSISGDAKTVKVAFNNHLYVYRMKER